MTERLYLTEDQLRDLLSEFESCIGMMEPYYAQNYNGFNSILDTYNNMLPYEEKIYEKVKTVNIDIVKNFSDTLIECQCGYHAEKINTFCKHLKKVHGYSEESALKIYKKLRNDRLPFYKRIDDRKFTIKKWESKNAYLKSLSDENVKYL